MAVHNILYPLEQYLIATKQCFNG